MASETYYAHRAQISMAEEVTPGTSISAPAHYPFHCVTFDLPDEAVEWQTIKAVGAGRDWNAIAEGAHTLEGSVEATLIKGDILLYVFGTASDTGTMASTGQTTLSTALIAGGTTATLTTTAGYTGGLYVRVGTEIRQVSSKSGSIIILDKGVRGTVASGSTASLLTGTVYKHTLSVGNRLPSFTLEYGQDGGTAIRRKFNGCYTDTCEFSCEAESYLQANLDIVGMNTSTADTAISTVTVPTTVPYMFDEGVITMFGGTIATVKSFSVTLNNNLGQNRYIRTTNGRNVSEIVPGNRVIELAVTAVPQDKTWTEKMRPEGQVSGTTFVAKFSRSATDYIQITCNQVHISELSQPIPEEGEIEAELTMVARSCTVEVSDSTPYYWMA